MEQKRAGLFDGEEPTIDVSGFAPKPHAAAPPRVEPERLRAVSEAARFPSREPQAKPKTPAPRAPRRYRTGRNVQLNIKARAEAIEAFYRIAETQGWVLGETFERAVDALKLDLERTP